MGVRFISPEELGVEIAKIISEYTEEVGKAIEEEIDDTTKKVKDEIVLKSPKLTGKYAKGWKIKKDNGKGKANRIIYNKDKPGLVHLLELGHVKRGGKGRVVGRPHLRPAYDKHVPVMEKRIEDIIRRGGK